MDKKDFKWLFRSETGRKFDREFIVNVAFLAKDSSLSRFSDSDFSDLIFEMLSIDAVKYARTYEVVSTELTKFCRSLAEYLIKQFPGLSDCNLDNEIFTELAGRED